MADIRIHRYAVDPENLDEFIARRAEVIGMIREEHPGLSEARLIRLEGDTYIDTWRWDSAEQMQAGLAAAPSFGQVAGAAWALTRDGSNEDGEVVDER